MKLAGHFEQKLCIKQQINVSASLKLLHDGVSSASQCIFSL